MSSGSILGNIIGFAYGAEQERIAKEELDKLPEYQQLQNISEISSLYDQVLRLSRRPYSSSSDSAFNAAISQGGANAYANTMRQDAGLANSVLGAAQTSGAAQRAQREMQVDALRGNYFSMLGNIANNMQSRSDTNINQGNARLLMQEQAIGAAIQQGKQKQYESAVQWGDASESKVGTIMGMIFGGGAGGQVKYDSDTVQAPQQQQAPQQSQFGSSSMQYGGYGYGPSSVYGDSSTSGGMSDFGGMGGWGMGF
jgi:hypothetical protein